MLKFHDIFHIAISSDRMLAEVQLKNSDLPAEFNMEEHDVRQLLKDYDIHTGIDEKAVRTLHSKPTADIFPVIIARGTPVKNGKDGKINFMTNIHPTEMNRSQGWNFRDVMQIPSVKKGEKIAEVIMPAEGENGKDVLGKIVQAKQGKPCRMKAGKNVVFQEKNQTFYAAINGQLNVSGKNIHVQPVYEVDETLSMKEGNLEFTGTIIIRGDVPSGYTVKAEGDIKVFGMVEAATLISGGSIFISEGLAGQKKGCIRAEESIHLGYINQGEVMTGKDLYAENSIIHSVCTVKSHVYCQKGNIIGGVLSIGKSLEARDVGTRFGTKTEIMFGMDKTLQMQEEKLLKEKKEVQHSIKKLTVLGEKLKQQNSLQNSKLRIMQLKQRHSYTKTKERLEEIEASLGELNANIGSELEAELIVNNNLFNQVTVAFGKYKRIINTDHHYVKMFLRNNEIVMEPLFH